MAGNGCALLCRRVFPDRMGAALTHKLTAVLSQMFQKVPALHTANPCGTILILGVAVNKR
jgi:hypothetical protein